MELARLDEAEECFLKALRLRRAKGIPSLIKSTEQALSLLKNLRMVKEWEGMAIKEI